MPADGPRYPLNRAKFRVEIEGREELTGWRRVDGLRMATASTPVRDEATGLPRHLPGLRTAGPIRLERLFDGDPFLAEWYGEHGTRPLNGSVVFLDYSGEEKLRYNWSGGWCSLYELGPFVADVDGDGPQVEVVEITVEDIFVG
jgi:hypothetical protein